MGSEPGIDPASGSTRKASSARTLMIIVGGLWVGVLVGALLIGGLAYAGAIWIPGISPDNADQAAQAAPRANLESGTMADDFDLPDLDGKQVKLSDLRGKVVVFNFWATWCKPCKEEMPMFQEFAARYPNFVMIGIDLEESAQVVKDFLSKFPVTYKILLDEKNTAGAAYRVTFLPTTIFVDERGEIRFRHYGEMSAEQMEYYLKTLKVIQD